MDTASLHEKLRQIPSVDEVLEEAGGLLERYPRALVLDEIRAALEHRRSAIRAGAEPEPHPVLGHVEARLGALEQPSLRPVINATGVVLHTNLGRAPLAPFTPYPGYSNLEYDLAEGRRGKRDMHLAGLMERLFGKPGIVVNNNAAAIYLALSELASGHEVIVSRGELIEIGDGFRIPDIMRASGAILREVGTTNRTGIEDYAAAINERTRLLMAVHPSNFVIRGFTAKPSLGDVVALGRRTGLPVYEDLGSGCVADLTPAGLREPLVRHSVEAGVDLISFSGDKLLGGAQAGFLVGQPELTARLRRNPMFRALRVDKLTIQALETVLRHMLLERWDRIPAIAMIREPAESIRERAERLLARLSGVSAAIAPGESVIGGGSTPEQALDTWLIVITVAHPDGFEQALRTGDPPVVARIECGKILLDLRTVPPEQEEALAEAVSRAAWASHR